MSSSKQEKKEGNALDRRRILLLIFTVLVVVAVGDIYINRLSIFESFARGFSIEVEDVVPTLRVERSATQDIADIEKLFMEQQGSMIVVSGDHSDQVTVTAVVEIYADDEEVAASFAGDLRLKLDVENGTLVPRLLEGQERGIRRVVTRWFLQVPQHLAVEIENRFGTIEVGNVYGPVELRGSGIMEVENIAGSVTVNSSFGTVKVVGVLGDALVKTMVGTVELANIQGDVELASATVDSTIRDVMGRVTAEGSLGTILIERVDGDVRVRSGTGSVVVRDVRSRIDIHAEIGDVVVRPSVPAPINVTIGQGDLRLNIPGELMPAYQFDLDAQEINGLERIRSLGAEQGTSTDAHLVKAAVRLGAITVF